MKKIMYFAALLAALAACSKPARKDFHLTGVHDLVVSHNGENALFGIEANPEDAWTLTSDADWFTVEQIEPLINDKTRVIVVVHYAGVACDMDGIMALAEQHHLLVVEDAAHSIDSFYKGRPLGGIGHLGAFSFHETKNINCGEGGMLVVNDERFIRRSEILWEKGTNRAEFYRGMVNKYGWCDMGSSFLPSELNAAFLWAQLEQIDDIQGKRKHIWESYDRALKGNLPKGITRPELPEYATNNYHMYYLLCESLEQRTAFINYLKNNGVQSTFHYLPLHSSAYYKDKHDGRQLANCDRYGNTLVRLPLFYELKDEDIDMITKLIKRFK